MLNVAVVGIGKMGLLHAGIMNGLEGVRLSAIADTSKFLLGFAQSLKDDLNIYDDYREMLDKAKPDAAVLATPVFLHVPMAAECVKRGIPFFLEKPLSIVSRDADDLVADIEKKKLTTMVGYMMRYVETFAKAKELLQSGALGEIITFNATIYVSQLFKTGKGWRYDKKESGGGVVIGQATHLIDLLHWYFGRVNYISAHTRNWYSQEVEDFAHVHFEFANGVTGWFDSSWSVRHHRLLEVSINVHAANGNLSVCDDYVKLFLDKPAAGFSAGWTNFMKPDLFEGVAIDLGGPQYTRQDADFINAVKHGNLIESDVKNAHEVQKIVDAVYSSAAKHGEPMKI
ncbi:Gfo/Idh/MocA family oxidoreductase [candidate division KSB1 bacterium]|nr:Gfo/Idh/MocA family oxidoreductase [candidate division KSB1 bacterium]